MPDSSSDFPYGFPYVNRDSASARYQQRYKTVEAGSDTFHVYESGDVELVTETKAGTPDTVAAVGTLPASVDPATVAPAQVAAVSVAPVSDPAGIGGIGAHIGAGAAVGPIPMAPTSDMPTASNPLIPTTQAPPVSQVQPLTPPMGHAHKDVTLGQLEPGLVWGIRQGLINPDSLAPHIIALLEDK